MGGALLAGILDTGLFPPERACAADKDALRLAGFNNLGVACEKSNKALSESSDIIILAVKPFDAPEAIGEIGPSLGEGKILISVVAGLTIKKIEKLLGNPDIPVIRAMPNINVKAGKGITAFCINRAASGYEQKAAEIFSSVGIAIQLPEDKMNTVTAIAGSGPGFIFYIAEIIKDICEKKGLSEWALEITANLLAGTGKLLLETGEEPADLKKKVSSPGGTTVAGLEVMDKKGLRATLLEAVDAAERRGSEISEADNE